MIETEPDLSAQAHAFLLQDENRGIFDVASVSTLREGFGELKRQSPDLILLDVAPKEDPDLSQFHRLRAHAPHVPLVVLIKEEISALSLDLIQKGAHGVVFQSQVKPDTFAPYLLRVIHRHVQAEAVRASEARFRLLIENASDIITTIDPTGVIHYAGPSIERMLDHPVSEITGRNVLDYIHRDDRRRFLDHFEDAFHGKDRLSPIQFRFRHAKNGWLHLEGKGRIVGEEGNRKFLVLNSRDITHRVKLENELRALSLRDELTGLHNRRSFMSFFEQELKKAQRAREGGVTLLFIDLDGFKGINDALGHAEGDKALIESTRILKNTFRDADIIARLGGDEFVVCLTNNFDEANVETLKSRLNNHLEEWNKESARPYRLQMSVGALTHDARRRASADELLSKADGLMYRQKRERKAARN